MTTSGSRYDDLAALYLNCTLKPSPQLSHTQGLIDASAGIMRRQGVNVENIRAADHDIATGVLVTVRISYQTRAWFSGQWRYGNWPGQRVVGFGFKRRPG